MSRHGYSDDCDDMWLHIRWRGQVTSAIRGKRGQAFLRELIAALEALPEKKLIAGELRTETGQVCALGAVGVKRGMNLETLDIDDYEILGSEFNIAEQLVREIEWENDENGGCAPGATTEERRWNHIHQWAKAHLLESGVESNK